MGSPKCKDDLLRPTSSCTAWLHIVPADTAKGPRAPHDWRATGEPQDVPSATRQGAGYWLSIAGTACTAAAQAITKPETMLASCGSSAPFPSFKNNGSFQKLKIKFFKKFKNLITSQKLPRFKDPREQNQAGFEQGSENKVGLGQALINLAGGRHACLWQRIGTG